MAGRAAHKKTTSRSRGVLIDRSTLCLMTDISHLQLLLWEHERLLEPVTSPDDGSPREVLYDAAALRRTRLIRTLAEDLEINLPGIDVILNLLDQIAR